MSAGIEALADVVATAVLMDAIDKSRRLALLLELPKDALVSLREKRQGVVEDGRLLAACPASLPQARARTCVGP